jgi:hypothetical protein
MKDHITELIYGVQSQLELLIKKEWPRAVFQDASDDIHTDRFEVEIDVPEGKSEEEFLKDFWAFAVREGFSLLCFGFRLWMGNDLKAVKEWLAKEGLLREDACHTE